MNTADFCFWIVLQLVREYGSDIHIVCLEAQALAKKQFTFKVFFITQLGRRHCLATITFILDI